MEDKKINCFLERIESNHNNLRTDTVEGFTYQIPKVGESFEMFGKGLEFGIRYIYTTSVQSIKEIEDGLVFKTLNSEYFFKVVEKNGLSIK